MLPVPASPEGSGPTYESNARSWPLVRAPTPDVKSGFESPCAVLLNCVWALGHAFPIVASATDPPEPSFDPTMEPSGGGVPVPIDPSARTDPSGERTPAMMRAASSIAFDGE